MIIGGGGVSKSYVDTQLANIAQEQKHSEDFLNTSFAHYWATGAVASGAIGNIAGVAKHPGIVQYTSHASNANSGAKVSITATSILLSGGEKTTIIFKTAPVLTGITRRSGFHDSADHNAPVDGAYVFMNGTTLDGRTMNNSVGSTTATNYTITADTWYRLKIELNSNATLVTFTLYADDSNTVLWTDTLATNIPKTTGREIGLADVATLLSPSAATVVGYIDYIDVNFIGARRVV